MKEIIEQMMTSRQSFQLVVTDYTATGGAVNYEINDNGWVITRLLADAFVISCARNGDMHHVAVAYSRINRVHWIEAKP